MHAPNPSLRELPSIHEVLAVPRMRELAALRGYETVRDWARQALDQIRADAPAGHDARVVTREHFLEEVIHAIMRAEEIEATSSIGPVINATGVVLHTGLGRAPLSAAAVSAVRAAAGACNLEVDLAMGDRQYRGEALQSVWRRLTGAEASLVVNNNAAATVLVLDALCRGREVIISRGQLIEIGGSFRLPDIFAQSGAILREAGTTNRTRLGDYESAINPNTAAILRVHPSNYRVVGFTDTPDICELSQMARQHGLLCVDDIGSGCLAETGQFGLPHEPTFIESVKAGADLVLGSGDKLLGGPQSGILLGRAELLSRLRSHPLARAFRVDKLTLAALTATLDSYLRGAAESEIPTLILLGASADRLFSRAEQIRDVLRSPPLGKGDVGGAALRSNLPPKNNVATRLAITIARDTAPVGGGSLPGAMLPTAVLRLKHVAWSADEVARRLRLGQPHVFGRIKEDEVLLDLRSVMPEDDEQIVAALRGLEGDGAP